MGFVKASILILLIAISVPLIYRHFVDEQALKTLTSYHPKFKDVDGLLRISAGHIDSARKFIPSTEGTSEKISFIVKEFYQFFQRIQSMYQSKAQPGGQEQATTEAPKISKTQTPESVTDKTRWCKCNDPALEGKKVKLWSKEELAQFDGTDSQKGIYLAYLGIVYDVSANQQHYGKGADYNIFTGKDASRAFITGNFSHDLHDHIGDLDEGYYDHLENWRSFYTSSYPVIGRLEGAFYDSQGCSTDLLKDVTRKLAKLQELKATEKVSEKQFPECNSEWNSDTNKGRVWCSTKSGGVERGWVGVPRIYDNGQERRCACFNVDVPEAKEVAHLMTMYPGCHPEASECLLSQ